MLNPEFCLLNPALPSAYHLGVLGVMLVLVLAAAWVVYNDGYDRGREVGRQDMTWAVLDAKNRETPLDLGYMSKPVRVLPLSAGQEVPEALRHPYPESLSSVGGGRPRHSSRSGPARWLLGYPRGDV